MLENKNRGLLLHIFLIKELIFCREKTEALCMQMANNLNKRRKEGNILFNDTPNTLTTTIIII